MSNLANLTILHSIGKVASVDVPDWDGRDGSEERKVISFKKPYHIKNPSKYFVPEKDRIGVRFSSPLSFRFREEKKEGYEVRLFYEFKYCQDNNGQTFFYTLTYNDNHIPRYLGQNCFDYEDLRYLLNGGFKKMLLRKYGTLFRYFVGAELGEGAGTRGMHNNPHYHVLFFLRSAEDVRFPYVKISPEDFRSLIRKYWQGFDQDKDGFKPYQDALFGIAKEGENIGLVTDFRAVSYVSKYVCKDVGLVFHERKIRRKKSLQYQSNYQYTSQSYFDYFHSRLFQLFSIPVNAERTEFEDDDCQLLMRLAICLPIHIPASVFDSDEYLSLQETIIHASISHFNLWSDYFKFVNKYVSDLVDEDIRIYRNRFCNKVRISQHTGEYALRFVQDFFHPSVPIPSKQGIKNRPLGLYYYRKMFTEVFTDIDGKKTRVLSSQGIEYKCHSLQKSIDKMSEKAFSYLSVLDETLYNNAVSSDVNVDFSLNYSTFISLLQQLSVDFSLLDICKRYAEFKLVYEDRYFSFKSSSGGNSPDFPPINPLSDLRWFLQPSVYMVERSSSRLNSFLASPGTSLIPYFSHPYFLRFQCVFDLLDLFFDYFFVKGDDQSEVKANEISKVKRFHKQRQLVDFYKPFK